MGNGNVKGQVGGGNLFIVAYFYICYTGHFFCEDSLTTLNKYKEVGREVIKQHFEARS